nr:NAD(P)H-dependent oxidoreductase [uncultured Holophaga sp.]
MRTLVLGGSPKGESSVTLRYVRFLAAHFPGESFEEVHVAAGIRRLEEDPEALRGLLTQVEAADLVLFAFPLYICLVHADYKRFFELVEERGATGAFRGKAAVLLATSIHFHDHLALSYMEGMVEDWGMAVKGVYSAHMRDLMRPAERARMAAFWSLTRARMEEPVQRRSLPRPAWNHTYASLGETRAVAAEGLRALVVTEGSHSGARAMADRFIEAFQGTVDRVDLDELQVRGGCRGCIQCGFDNRCIYGEGDGVQSFYRERLRAADIVVWAFPIRDRYFSARVKTLQDRRFLDTHQPQAVGKQVVHLVSGPLASHPSLRQLIEAMEEFNGGNLAALVTDESQDDALIGQAIDAAAATAVACHRAGYQAPRTFLGVASAKLFRDEIWGHLRFVFQGDHRYYRRHGLYDFPQRDWRTRLLNAVMMPLSRIPAVRKGIRTSMIKHMVAPLDRVLEGLSPASRTRP